METFKKLSSDFDEDEEEKFINSDKVISIINLLTKHKIKLWELPDLNGDENKLQTEVIFYFKNIIFILLVNHFYTKGFDHEII